MGRAKTDKLLIQNSILLDDLDHLPSDVLQARGIGFHVNMMVQRVAVSIWVNFALAGIQLYSKEVVVLYLKVKGKANQSLL